MRSTLSLLVIPAVMAIGCGGGTKKPTSTDMAVKVTTQDMNTSDGCTQVGAWPTSDVSAFSDTTQTGFPWVDGVGDREANAMTSGHLDELLYRYYQETGKPTPQIPHDYDIDESDTYGICLDCVTAFLDYDPNDSDNTGTFYFATSGSLHVEKLDHGTETGTVAASGTNLHLVHWDYDFSTMTDKADPDGKCIDVASFDFTGTYDNTPTDGGTDGGN